MIEISTIQDVIAHGEFGDDGQFRLRPGVYALAASVKLPSKIQIGNPLQEEGIAFAGGDYSWRGHFPTALAAGTVHVHDTNSGSSQPDSTTIAREIWDRTHCSCCAHRA